MLKEAAVKIGLIAECAESENTLHTQSAEWSGVDKSVVEKVAKEAGRSPSQPVVNTESGDLMLFLFLLAGTVAGFIGGLYFRQLFPIKSGANDRQPNV